MMNDTYLRNHSYNLEAFLETGDRLDPHLFWLNAFTVKTKALENALERAEKELLNIVPILAEHYDDGTSSLALEVDVDSREELNRVKQLIVAAVSL